MSGSGVLWGLLGWPRLRLRSRLACALLLAWPLLWMCAGRAGAQGPTDAAMRVRVTDVRGTAVKAAEVRVRLQTADTAGVARDLGVVARTDARGECTLVGMEPGEYSVEVWLPGGAGFAGRVEVALEPGEIRELELGADAGSLGLTLLDDDPEGSGVVAGRGSGGAGPVLGAAGAAGMLPVLPLEDQQWETVQGLSSAGHEVPVGDGSVQDGGEEPDASNATAGGENGPGAGGLSFDGVPPSQNAQRVDGLSGDEFFAGAPRGAASGGQRVGSSFAQGAVGSVRALPRTFSAQYGGGAGGLVTVGSRKAGAGVRGSAFLQVRQSAWAATNPFSVVSRYNQGMPSSVVVKPHEGTVQFGGSVGAPLGFAGMLRRWRAGVFGAVEGQVSAQTVVSSPLTASFFELTPTQTALLATRGVSGGAVRAALSYLDGLTGSTVTYAPRTLGFLRLDAVPRRADRLSLSVQMGRQSAPATGGGWVSEGVMDRAIGSIGTSEGQTEAYTAQWQHAFGARASQSLRLQYAHDLRFETPAAASPSVPGIGPGGYAPQVAIQPEGFRYGTPASLGRVAYPDEQRVEVADSVALRLGRHVVTVGGDWSRVRERVLSATNLEGAFLYDSGTTNGRAGGLVDWITDYTFNVHAYPNGGCPSIYAPVHDFCFRSYSQSFTGEPLEFATHQFAGFVEDSVRLRKDLVGTLGVRYDYLLLPFPQRPNPELDSVLATLNSPVTGATGSFPEDRNNFGPRVSVAWSPGEGRRGHWLTLRAGYGLFYGRLPGATVDAALADTDLPGSTTSLRILPTTETECPQVSGTGINQGFGYPCAFLSAPGGVAAQTASAMVFARGFRLPAVQRGAVSLEREMGRRLFVRGEYATAWATELPDSVDLNIAPSTSTANFVIQGGDGHPGLHTGDTFSVPLYPARRTGLYGPVTAVESNANATYHSGTAELRVRGWHGWDVRGSYTFSRAIDYGPQSGATPRQNGQFDPFTDGYDKGLSSLQMAHRFAGYLVYRSEVREGRPEVRRALSGWRFSAVGVGSSGAPYSYAVFGGTRLTGGHESINGSGGATYLPTVGRNTLRLPARGRVDLRVAREMAVGRRARLELRADAFNVLNSVSVSRVETRAFLLGAAAGAGGPIPLVFQDAAAIATEGLTTPAFGTALSSTSATGRERQVEFGARVTF